MRFSLPRPIELRPVFFNAITLRLTLVFAALTAMVCVGYVVGSFLLLRHLQHEEDKTYLLELRDNMREILDERVKTHPSAQQLRHLLAGPGFLHHPEFWLIVWDRAGRPLYQSPKAPRLTIAHHYPATTFYRSNTVETASLHQHTFKWVLGEVRESQQANSLVNLRFAIVHEDTPFNQLMNQALASMLLLGLLLLVPLLLGFYWATVRGLRPLDQVRACIARLPAQPGNERLPTGPDGAHTWPKELVPVVSAYNHQLERSEVAFSRIRQFSDEMAHQLRMPLQTFRLELEDALGKQPDNDALVSMMDDLDGLLAVINHLLFLSRLEHGDAGLSLAPVNVSEQLDTLMDLFAPMAEDRNLQLTLVAAGTSRLEPEACTVLADERLMRVALSNVLSNALKYTPTGGQITLRLLLNEPHEDVASSSRLGIAITDTGIGIASDEQKFIYERFYRVDKSGSRQIEGDGLGLSIVQVIMALHGGEITLDSQLGQGSTFTLWFPVVSLAL